MKNKKEKSKNIKIIIMGLLTGFLSGLFSSGGGLIAVPGFVYFLKTTEKEARAMSIFCILPMVIISLILYNQAQYIDWKTGILCGIGGLVGGIVGTKVMEKLKDKYLQLFFIIFLIYSSILILRK